MMSFYEYDVCFYFFDKVTYPFYFSYVLEHKIIPMGCATTISNMRILILYDATCTLARCYIINNH